MTVRKLKCGCCDENFDSEITDEAATAEFTEKFPGHKVEDASVICEACYDRFWAWVEQHPELMKGQ